MCISMIINKIEHLFHVFIRHLDFSFSEVPVQDLLTILVQVTSYLRNPSYKYILPY